MSTIDSYPQGAPCYIELHTPDQAAAKTFYAGLFGWDLKDVPMGEGQVYTDVLLGERQVAGITGQLPGMEDHPAFWSVYLRVDDVDATAAKVADLGGVVEAPPFDVATHGRMAAIQDPTKARVNLWQPADSLGTAVREEPGGVDWNELVTPDVEAAKAFYAGLLGVGFQTHDMGGAGYTVLQAGGQDWAGVTEPPPGMEGVPPHWNCYLSVADVDAAAAKATELGGRAMDPFDVPGVGRMVLLTDPQGGMFWVMKGEPRQG